MNAVDAAGIVTALETAEEKGIPVITVDMKPSAGTYVTYIGSDNFLGGELAARWTADESVSYTHLDVYKRQVAEFWFGKTVG